MYDLKIKRNRPLDFVIEQKVVATYTLDQSYVAAYDLVTDPVETHKLLPAGYVVALNPATQKVVPNYSSYSFGAVGIVLDDVDMGQSSSDYHDREVNVLWRGIVLEDFIWDNGDYGSVLQGTKSALLERILFVKETNLTGW